MENTALVRHMSDWSSVFQVRTGALVFFFFFLSSFFLSFFLSFFFFVFAFVFGFKAGMEKWKWQILTYNNLKQESKLMILPAKDPPPQLYPWEVYSELKKINPIKSGGPDKIPGKIVKEFAYELSIPLTNILNASFTEGIVPTQWKKVSLCLSQNKIPLVLTSYGQFHWHQFLLRWLRALLQDGLLMILGIQLTWDNLVMYLECQQIIILLTSCIIFSGALK